jgi:hypothetical protein
MIFVLINILMMAFFCFVFGRSRKNTTRVGVTPENSIGDSTGLALSPSRMPCGLYSPS